MRRLFLGIGLVVWGCKKNVPPEAHVDNAAARYASGLVTSTEKAHVNADKAQQSIAASQAAVDQLAEEAQ